MKRFLAIAIVFVGGFAVMVLEIIGALFLAKDFGSSFYVWISQIGVILVALAAGYYAGGELADFWHRASFLGCLLLAAGLLTFWIPDYSPRLIDAIVLRHPLDEPIPPIWQKLDPALGSTVVFFLPCFILAMLTPTMIRLTSEELSRVGRTSGLLYASSTMGSIAGVFVSGYVLIDVLKLSQIFKATGVTTMLVGALCLLMDRLGKAKTPPPES